jgi:hypothetical protein
VTYSTSVSRLTDDDWVIILGNEILPIVDAAVNFLMRGLWISVYLRPWFGEFIMMSEANLGKEKKE